MGAGAVALVVPGSLAAGYAGSPDLMTRAVGAGVRFDATDTAEILAAAERFDVMVLGPGLGPGQASLVERLAADWHKPLLIDADGLNALDGLGALASRAAPTVITPHAGEFVRLTGAPADAAAAAALADRAGAVVLLKGNPTVVAGTESWLVTSGGPELATVGTGDVLAGAIGALWARGLDAEVAVRSGAYWHGVAGNELWRDGAFSASDLAKRLARLAF